LLAGPIFSREALTAPRQIRHFLIRTGYVALLFILMYTAGQATYGWQQIRNVGDLARFGTLIFQLFSLFQLTLVLFFSLLFAAGSVAQEKDRQTLILLLMTDLRNSEMVFGKLFASLLIVAVLLGASLPVFAMVHMLGGVTTAQIGWTLALCASTGLAAGSWATLVAYWRDKTFQTLAISVLGLVLFIGLMEAIVNMAGVHSISGSIAGLFNPYRTLIQILDPYSELTGKASSIFTAGNSVLAIFALAVGLSSITIARLRIWNPSRHFYLKAETNTKETVETKARVAKTREIWSNPVIWREICTRAYGKKVAYIKLAYLLLTAFLAYSLYQNQSGGRLVMDMISPAGFAFAGLSLMSLIMVNAQAVTAFTSERDGKTLELLLVTSVTAKEFVFGKLGGILFNTKEIIIAPLLLLTFPVISGLLSLENLIYVVVCFLVLVCFSAMLGLHAGLTYDLSRTAIANSLGTMFFLFIGIFIFMILLVEARSSFFLQFQSFLVFIGLGSVGLYASLTHKNQSTAFTITAIILPFLTFYSITSFLLGGTLEVTIALCFAYGFAIFAMLIPAISDFDAALGRASYENS